MQKLALGLEFKLFIVMHDREEKYFYVAYRRFGEHIEHKRRPMSRLSKKYIVVAFYKTPFLGKHIKKPIRSHAKTSILLFQVFLLLLDRFRRGKIIDKKTLLNGTSMHLVGTSACDN